MEYTQLDRSGLKVSRLCLGTMNFGPQTEESDAHAIMDSALDAGINFCDGAVVYAGSRHRGWTEEILGRWFAEGGERRERTVLATRVYGTVADRPNESRLSALHIRQALGASLRRSGTRAAAISRAGTWPGRRKPPADGTRTDRPGRLCGVRTAAACDALAPVIFDRPPLRKDPVNTRVFQTFSGVEWRFDSKHD